MRFVGRHGGHHQAPSGPMAKPPQPLAHSPDTTTPLPEMFRRCSGDAPAMLRRCSHEPKMAENSYLPSLPHLTSLPSTCIIVGNPTKSACLFVFQTKENKTRVMVCGKSFMPTVPPPTYGTSSQSVPWIVYMFRIPSMVILEAYKPLCAGIVPRTIDTGQTIVVCGNRP